MKSIVSIFLPILLFVTLFTSCQQGPVEITDIQTCTSVNGEGLCTENHPEIGSDADTVFVTGMLRNTPRNTDIEIIWNYIGDGSFDKEEITILEVNTEDRTGDMPLFTHLSPPDEGWPLGEYEVIFDVKVEGFKPVTATFSIE